MSKYKKYQGNISQSIAMPSHKHEQAENENRATTNIAPSSSSSLSSSPTSVLSTVHLTLSNASAFASSTSTNTSAVLSPPTLLSADDTFQLTSFQLTPSSYHIDLETFVRLLPDTIRNRKASAPLSASTCYSAPDCASMNLGASCAMQTHSSASNASNTCTDPVGALFRRLQVSQKDLEPFCFIDQQKNYTRNLIATDDETLTLLLLCWNPGKYSPIHDHPCDGCWMRVCQGRINEVRYNMNKKENNFDGSDEKEKGTGTGTASSSFTCTMDTTFEQGNMTFIDDDLGYHKVGNPCEDAVAISMHLYSPPFAECKIWMDQMDASSSSTSRMCNYSEYGERKSYRMSK